MLRSGFCVDNCEWVHAAPKAMGYHSELARRETVWEGGERGRCFSNFNPLKSSHHNFTSSSQHTRQGHKTDRMR